MRFNVGRDPASVSDARGRPYGNPRSATTSPTSQPLNPTLCAVNSFLAAQDCQREVSTGIAGILLGARPSREGAREALETVVAQQNAAWHARRQCLLNERERRLAHASRQAQILKDSRQRELRETRQGHMCGPSAGAVLCELLAESRARWQSHLSSRISALKREVQSPVTALANDTRANSPIAEPFNKNSGSNGVSVSISGADRTGPDDVAWSVHHLFDALVSGLNSTATASRIDALVHRGKGTHSTEDHNDTNGQHSTDDEQADSDSYYDGHDGIDAHGLLTVFQAPVQSLLARDISHALVPSLTALRRGFAALDPSCGTTSTRSRTSSSAHVTDANLDALLRRGDGPLGIVAALRGSVCPTVRRLLYARALQLPLVVTDGTSLFGGRAELRGNQIGDPMVASLSFATKYCRDKIRRRMHHSYSSREQEAMAKFLQAVTKVDTLQYVGDSDRYFIFVEETELLALSLVVDRSLLDVRLHGSLQQLGHPPEMLDAYVVPLRSMDNEEKEKEGVKEKEKEKNNNDDNIVEVNEPPTAPSCGFFPISSCSLLIAPICYITGDTVEQYELAAAFFGQLWGRLQGPTPELAQCCWIFESLVARFAASACLHACRKLRMPPLLLAMHWMLSGFVGVLEPTELLKFWDIILSYHVDEMFAEHTPLAEMSFHTMNTTATNTTETTDLIASNSNGENASDIFTETNESMTKCAPCALWLLPLLAASLFVYRAPLVERCATADEMMLVFQEGHHVRCRPLLQYLLFMAK